jgi:hypothetical protein
MIKDKSIDELEAIIDLNEPGDPLYQAARLEIRRRERFRLHILPWVSISISGLALLLHFYKYVTS